MLYRTSKYPYFVPFRPYITTELRPILRGVVKFATDVILVAYQ